MDSYSPILCIFCFVLILFLILLRGKRGLVVGRWTCNPEVPGSNPTPCHQMDLPSVAPNAASPRCVNSQLVSLPLVGILNLSCLIYIIFVCNAHLSIFTWNLHHINVYYYHYYYYYCYLESTFFSVKKDISKINRSQRNIKGAPYPKMDQNVF